jgi:hypothetical protein
MIIARGLDSEDTKGSAKYISSALLWPSLMLEEIDKAMRRVPKNEPPEARSWVTLIISMMKDQEGIDRGREWKLRCATHQLNLVEPS